MKNFTINLAIMFNAKNELLLNSKHLDIKRKLTATEAHKKMLKFIKEVSK